MSVEENKDVIRRWVELWNTKNIAGVNELVTPDYTRYESHSPLIRGPEAQKQLVTMFLTAFPDLHFTIEDLFAEGDRVAGRYTGRGTHKGELMGIPPTNRQINITVFEIYRIENGKIAEQWLGVDNMGMMQQLGVIPAPGQATGAGAGS